MISSDEEDVSFNQTVFTAEAKGMVEKWLHQVEIQMIASLRKSISDATVAYKASDFSEWIMKYPGQSVLAARSITWTSSVTEGIKNQSLKEFYNKCNTQLQTVVNLVRQDLKVKDRKTLTALIVVDVHGRDAVGALEKERVRLKN